MVVVVGALLVAVTNGLVSVAVVTALVSVPLTPGSCFTMGSILGIFSSNIFCSCMAWATMSFLRSAGDWTCLGVVWAVVVFCTSETRLKNSKLVIMKAEF